MTTAVLTDPARPTSDEPSRRILGRPRCEVGTLAALLVATAALYLWNLSASGWANDFYAAAVQAGSQSWKAWLFGSLDPAGGITVDKPPASLWVMGLSARIFGFGSWSMLVPQALMGVGAVAALYGAVRRWAGPAAGLLAGAVLALTPVAALMFRFNNPDALMVLGAYCVVRATDVAGGRWLALAGVALGFAFLTKMLEALVVLPAFALVFLVAAPTSLRARLGKLLGAAVALIVSGGWFLVVVALWPATSRPYIGGSTDNSLLQLALGYNGAGRILGGEGNFGSRPHAGPPPGAERMLGHGPGGGMFGGSAGITRLFGDPMGTQISWLLPAALIGLAAVAWLTRRAPRTDRSRAALILWGGWLLVTGAVFSYMQGIIHPYYTVALAPAVAASTAIAGRFLWRRRREWFPRIVLAVMLAAAGVWAFVLLDRTPDWNPWLRWLVLAGSLLVAVIIVFGAASSRRAGGAIVAAGVLLSIAAPAAFAVTTVTRAESGPIPIAGPTAGRSFGMMPPGATTSPGAMTPPGGPGFGGPGFGGPGFGGPGFGGPGFGGPGFGGAGFGGAAVSPQLQQMLQRAGTRWAAATVASQLTSQLELKTGTPVLAIGGFMGSDPYPTLDQFKQYVATHQVRYFIADNGRGGGPGGMPGGGPGGGPGMHGSGPGRQISEWVKQNFNSTTVSGLTVYDLSSSS